MTDCSGAAAAVFPSEPERQIYNNAILDRGMSNAARRGAVDTMEAAYAAAGVADFAAWVHESDVAMADELCSRGYSLSESTRAMGMTLDDFAIAPPPLDLAPLDWSEYLRLLEVPDGLLAGADPDAFHVIIARLDGVSVATAMTFDSPDGDCGVFNVSTLAPARRRGLATAVVARHLHDAVGRGCRTASLQSTEMGERVYAAIGFRDLGRILEFVPRPGRR